MSPERKGVASLPEAIDLSHHLSALARARSVSPLKNLARYYGRPGIISLAGGLPSPEYFPFDTVKADILSSDKFVSTPDSHGSSSGPLSWLLSLFSSESDSTIPISIPKYPSTPTDLNLATALQYGVARGIPQLQSTIVAFTTRVFQPAYADATVLLHVGNTDGWSKAVTTLCNPGEGVLVSDWTYPSALETMYPQGVRAVPVRMDGQGMSATGLREVLAGWDAAARGMPRPHVMYIVPVGQNPTGATMGAERKQEIYNICVEFDVIIVEDDPYYFLQEGPYVHPTQRFSTFKQTDMSDDQYLASLAPSFLKFDYQGRVVRLDTFSKTIAPGSRAGWFTCNPIFAERLERAAETSSQGPSGFTQVLIGKVLQTWQDKGYIQWLKGLGTEYTRRRNFFIDTLLAKFHLEVVPADSPHNLFPGTVRYIASAKGAYLDEKRGSGAAARKPLFSFVPPTSGMFIWLQLHLEDHPKFKDVAKESLEMQLWVKLAEGGLLIGPGNMFAADKTASTASYPGHFRISFSNADDADLVKAIDIFAAVITKFHQDV
ncbi:Aromatic amino acid aminotransferase C56E4.03 [Psilocybe cubensis]|uniref:Aromatic amino acid aminotransferase C56E4.03 n=2 Tax=Psilocybe cubensis TaxID=181762 RepID=A0ACB8H4Y2_PSICU|nr:Aromatic amino acid aminotransferase C56E4.03 [Psilocybe cubensis]KAH9483055.1 Aromatic amino acid aminotransferase C56E4.03 [Psilocybe cubensis]